MSPTLPPPLSPVPPAGSPAAVVAGSPGQVHPRIEELLRKIRARNGVLVVTTGEEERFLRHASEWVCRDRQVPFLKEVWRWSVTEGLVPHPRPGQPEPTAEDGAGPLVNEETQSLAQALDRLRTFSKKAGALVVLRDAHHYLKGQDGPRITRRLRDLAHAFRGSSNCVVLLSPHLELPADLQKDITVSDFPLPTPPEIALLVDGLLQEYLNAREHGGAEHWTAELRAKTIRACTGLTEMETQDALAMALIEFRGVRPQMVESIHRTKREVIKRLQCLEAMEADVDLDQTGGVEVFKEWITKRTRTWSDEARAFGIPYPKGVVALGVPGGGKSLSARGVARTWGLPLLRLDMGAVFGGIVGESENNMRQALKLIEAVAPCVVMIDEMEKGLSGMESSGKSDGGTTTRVLGTLLTWLQDRTAPVFCYFTANNVAALPPELLRKGRIDEIFFFDLPTHEERIEIFRIHLRKKRRDPQHFDLDRLASECEGFTGSEIEQVLADALIEAFHDRAPDITDQHLLGAITRTIPMVKTQRDKLEKILAWVKQGRAKRASRGKGVELTQAFFDNRDFDFPPAVPAAGDAADPDAPMY